MGNQKLSAPRSRYLRYRILIVVFLLLITTGASRLAAQQQLNLHQEVAAQVDTTSIQKKMQLGISLKSQQPDSAIAILMEALQESRQINYSSGISRIAFHISAMYANMGRLAESEALLRECIHQSIHDPIANLRLPYIYGNLASIYIYRGLFEAAAYYLYQAIAYMHEQPQSYPAINLYNNLAVTLLNLSDTLQPAVKENAWYYLNLAQHYATMGNHRELLVAALINKGEFYLKEKQFAKAHQYLDSAQSLVPELPEFYQSVLTTRAEVYLESNQPQLAIPVLEEAIKIHNTNPYYVVSTQTKYGKALIMTGNYSKAKTLLLDAEHNALRSGLNYNLLDIYQLLSQVYEHLHQYKEALHYHKKHLSTKDQISGTEVLTNIKQLEIKYNTAQKDRELVLNQLLISKQAQKIQRNNMVVIGTIGGMLVLILSFTVIHRNLKHKQRIQAKQIRILEQEQKLLMNEQEIIQLKAMIKGEEKERARIAQDLHDGIGGMIAAAKMNLDSVKRDIPEKKHQLDRVTSILWETSDEIRKTAQNLMPHILLKHNLQKALETYCENISNKKELSIDLQFHGYTPLADKSMELMIYRMIQELVQNIIKHAKATHAEIQIMQYDGKLHITVEDNGKGFDTNQEFDGLGLQNLQHRVNTLKGYLSITSTPQNNTTVHMEFDLEKLNLAVGPL